MSDSSELDFWSACKRMLEIYPQRPGKLSSDTEEVRLCRRLRDLAAKEAKKLSPGGQWIGDASVGKGNWTNVPWLAIFDKRETTSAQKGVYPVVHFSCEQSVGFRMGLGVAATEFKGDPEAKAAEVFRQLDSAEVEAVRAHGFTDVVSGVDKRVSIGSSKLSEGYSKGMIFERFVPVAEIESSKAQLNDSLQVLLNTYRSWVDRNQSRNTSQASPASSSNFLDLMRWYSQERIVFLSTNRQSRYFISSVDDGGCSIQRIDANESERATLTGYQSKLDWLRQHGGQGDRSEFEYTVARQMAYLQGADVGLTNQRSQVVLLDSEEEAIQNLMDLVADLSSPQLYKPMIIAIVVAAIDQGELKENRITFDWLLPKFVDRFKQLDRKVEEQQLAEGFARLAGGYFWLLAYHDPRTTMTGEQPTASQIRSRVRFAAFKEPYWQALQVAKCRQSLLSFINTKWNLDMNSGGETEGKAPADLGLADAVEALIRDIEADGFTFEPWQIATYVTAIRTKPFVILAGVSGTGKSKLPALVAKHTGGHSQRISVRPDWTDSSEVLGYVDLQNNFRSGALLNIAQAASRESDKYSTCIIDEMNLARVEYYFAEVLSCIEDRKRGINGGFESDVLLSLQLDQSLSSWQSQTIPPNLGIVGTVNMDESTHGFSRKVLDRAFTIELSEVDLDWRPVHDADVYELVDMKRQWPIHYWYSRASRLSELTQINGSMSVIIQSAIELLKVINASLTQSQLQVGYRTRDEIVLFLINAEEVATSFRSRDNTKIDPVDLAISMKILPRIAGGSNAIRRTLMGLLGIAITGQPYDTDEDFASQVEAWDKSGRPSMLPGAKLPRSAARLCLMWDRLELEGFTSYWL
jgi:hypothetical protein